MRTGYLSNKESFGYTDSVDSIVVGMCRDFERRTSSLRNESCGRRTAMEFRFLNSLIFDAASEIVGEKLSGIFIEEIGNRTGFAYSKVDCFSESAYKLNKQQIKLGIARKLHLID